MSIVKSMLAFAREANYNPITIFHAILYGATVTYLRVCNKLVKIAPKSIRSRFGQNYHSKVIRLDDASRIIKLNRNVELRNLEQVIPFKQANDIILKNPQNIIVYECPCRAQKDDPCRPTDVCLVIGDPFVDLVRMFHPYRSRGITSDEALKIIKEEDARGHVHTAWFKSAMLNRFFAICNCCKCCCLGMKFMREYGVKMLIPSGYLSTINEKCTLCGKCFKACQFEAIELKENGDKKVYRVNHAKCFGCGICEGACEYEAISITLAPEKGIPLNIEALAGKPEEWNVDEEKDDSPNICLCHRPTLRLGRHRLVYIGRDG
ncbi:MAG: 4Fe-4S binding protein [Nitrospinota bacterium]|nr:4Fe-4S binding protein [Nitrospinota bacterium]